MLLRIEKTKYFTGANEYVLESALCLSFTISTNANSIETTSRFVRLLSVVGLSSSEISTQANKIMSSLHSSLKLFSAALAAVLRQGIIKDARHQPRVIECGMSENITTITTQNEVAARQAAEMLLAVFNEANEDSVETLRSFISFLATKSDQPSLGIILKAAENRGIPWLWNEGTGYHQLGHGRHRKRIEGTITGNLSALGVDIVRRKSITNKILRSLALPVPQSMLVNELDDAILATKKMGFPVVVKPMIGHKGIGITVGVNSSDELIAAFKKARKLTRSVIIEEFIPGGDVRLLVVGRKLVAAASRSAPHVLGDSKSTIAQLIHAENAKRIDLPEVSLQIEINDDLMQTLAGQGLTLDSVLPENIMARLRTVANWSQGGTATDLTDMVHPDNADMAVRAALAVGIDVAGVDFITPDISRPYYEVGGAICEINYRPGLRVHMAADLQSKRDIGSPIVENMFVGDGRIDVVFMIDAGDGRCAAALARCYSGARKSAQVACAYDAPEGWQKQIAASLEDPDCDALIINAPAAAIMELGTGVSYGRIAVQFGYSGSASENTLLILKQICRTHCMLTAKAMEDTEAVATHIADALELVEEMQDPPRPFAKKTTSRSMWEVAEDFGLAVNAHAHWDNKSLLQIGYGARRSVYRGARTGATSHIAARIADDKRRTNAILRMHGLPHSTQAVVETAISARQAVQDFGFPVIVKPTNSSESRGVTGNVTNEIELDAAVRRAQQFSKKVIIEPFLPGKDHKFLIIGGKVAHVTCHEMAQVLGDGRRTVAELVSQANENPIRGPNDYQPYTYLSLETDALRMLTRQGLSVTSVPAIDQIVYLSSICSLSTGGTAVDATAIAHADNITAAERVARLVGLDICGVDFLLPDVSKSYRETGGAILEVNQRPSFDMHDASTNSANNIRSLVLQELSLDKENGAIPMVHCILNGVGEAEAIARSVVAKMRSKLGLTAGAVVPELGLAMVGCSTIKSAAGEVTAICRSILADSRVEAALYLSSKKLDVEIPEAARIVDLRSHNLQRTVDSPVDTIFMAFEESSLTRHRGTAGYGPAAYALA